METDRTVLEINRNTCDGSETIQLETADDARILFGGHTDQPGYETPRSRICVNLRAKAMVYEDGEFKRDIHLQLWITPGQLAEIVKEFFVGMLRHTSPVYRSLLERLLRKRWSVMTDVSYKVKYSEYDHRVEPYHKIRM